MDKVVPASDHTFYPYFIYFFLQINSVNTVFDLVAFSVAPKILEALNIAETYMEKTEHFSGKVRYLKYIDIFMCA